MALVTSLNRRTPPGVRELKHLLELQRGQVFKRRTPPGVRELKHLGTAPHLGHNRRTPPGVRELKPCWYPCWKGCN